MAMGPSMGKVSFPARCAVAVVCGEHLVSQVYPASVPIEVFIDNVVELLNDELKRRGFNGLPTGVGYELHKANGVRLDVTKTLDELGVEAGATLALVPAVVSGGAGLVVAGGAGAVWQWWPRRIDLVDGLGWLAVPLLAASLPPAAPGKPGAPHVFIAALAAAVLICALATATRRHVNAAAAAVTVCALGGMVAAPRMWWPVPAQWLGMGTLVTLLLLLTLAPTIALRVARIRPPYFGSITGRDLFRRSAGLPADAVSPVDEATDDETNADTTPRGSQIAASAVRANNVLTGICVGAGLTLPAAVWATLMPGHRHSGPAAGLAGLVVLIFSSHG